MASSQSFSHILSFQGRLADPDTGKPLADGQYQVTFTIYDTEAEGTSLWTETQDVTLAGGLFSVYLGSATPFPGDLFADGDRWVAIQVAGDAEMAERIRFTPAPWALYSASSGPDDDWEFSGDDIHRLGGNVGIGTSTPASMLDVQSIEGTYGIMSEVPWIAVWAHRASTTGTWPAIHGECDSEGSGGSAIRGIMTSTSPGSSSAAVLGINNGTGAAGIGVYGTQDGSGYGVYGYTPDGRGVFGHSSDGTGVAGTTDSTSLSASGVHGVINRTSPGLYSAGVRGHNNGTGSFGYGVLGTQNGSGIGVYGSTPSGYGVYGTSTDGTGVWGSGGTYGGYFEDSDDSSYAYVAVGDRGITAYGTLIGGVFDNTDHSSYAYVASDQYGISAHGALAGGYLGDTDADAWAHVAGDTYKIYGNGSVAFVQNHPDDAEKVIVYACPEGDEVATYTRGTARLVNGRATVPLGETFKWVTNPDIGLTAHLTPRGEWADLYIVSLTTEELVVASRDPGSDAAFHYIVYGLRIGFEEVSVVQEKTREAYIPSMADHRALYERRPELRAFNALERFKRMCAAAGEPGDVDLTRSQELRDRIVEFDPAVHGVDVPVE